MPTDKTSHTRGLAVTPGKAQLMHPLDHMLLLTMSQPWMTLALSLVMSPQLVELCKQQGKSLHRVGGAEAL